MTGKVTLPNGLRDRYQEGRLVPFVGAGASIAVTWSENGEAKRGISWAELVDMAASLIGFDDADLLRVRGTDLQILEYFRQKEGDSVARLQNWFTRAFNPPDPAIIESEIHLALTDLHRCPIYYTTNYDDYLERALRLAGRPTRSVAVERDVAAAIKEATDSGRQEVQVVKFHGDLDNPDRMVLSEGDYESRMKFTAVEDRRFVSDLIGRAVLFVGYSFRDWNVSYLFRLLNQELGKELPEADGGKRSYIVVADPSDFEIKLFAARNMSVIPVRSEHITEDTAAVLRALA